MPSLRLVLLTLALAGTAADAWAQSEVRASALIGLARVSRDAGNAVDAARYYERARAIRPLSASETTEYFWIVATVDPQRALELAREVLRSATADVDLRDAAIRAAISLRDESSVRAFAEEGRRIGGNPAHWSRRLGESYLRSNRPADAATAYQAAAAGPQGEPADWLAAAAALTAAERYPEALAAWRSVPSALLDERPAQARLRLLAFARSAPVSEAENEIATWHRSHGFDPMVQDWLVDALVRAGDLRRALAAAQPLTRGTDAERWLRRSGQLARDADMPGEAASAYEALVRLPRATRADRLTLLEVLLDQSVNPRTLSLADDLVRAPGSCEERLLLLLDRLPGTGGTDRLRQAAERGRCIDSAWGRRIVERSVAEQRYDVALGVMDQITADVPDDTLLRAQLQLWTGAAAAAVVTLEPLVARRPGDVEARMTLVDALRASHRPYDAFAAAQPLIDRDSLAAERLLPLADLAIDADRPDVASALVARLPEPHPAAAEALEGRVLLARGKPREAAALLRGIEPGQLPPAAALALIDAVLASEGPAAARVAGHAFQNVNAAWQDVGIRRLMVLLLAGDDESALTLRQALCASSPTPCSVAAAEAHLRLGRPDLSLTDLAALPDGVSARVDRVRAAALEAAGDFPAALAIVSRLHDRSPLDGQLAFRTLMLEWQVTREPAALERLVSFAGEHRDQAGVQSTVGRILVEDGKAERAITLLGAGDAGASGEQRLVLAEALGLVGRPADALAALDALEPGSAAATPLKARLLGQMATEHLRRGEYARARTVAEQALALDGTNTGAWFTLIDAAAATATGLDDARLLTQLSALRSSAPSLLPPLGDHVAGAIRGHETIAVHLIDILGTVADAADVGPTLTRARLHMALEQWTPALQELDAARARSPHSLEVLRMRADVLGWSGQHAAADVAYDEYLTRAPSDVDAWRRQARVLGWSGRYNEANRRYEALRRRFPRDGVIAAEADAKRAFYAGQWQRAAAAYGAWLRVEPANSEARFERAVALRAAGQPVASEAELTDLALHAGHRLAAVALDQSAAERRPAAAVTNDYRSASGFAGTRLLALQQQQAALSLPIADGHTARIGLSAGQVRATGAGQSRTGFRAAVDAHLALSSRLSVDGGLGTWSFSSATTPEARLAATLNLDDHFAVIAGLQQQAVLENLATVDDGLAARGLFTGLRYRTAAVSVDSLAAWQRLSDGNTRGEFTIAAGRLVSERLPSLRLVAWGQALSHVSRRPQYFSPRSFLRLDGGAEFTHFVQRPRFAGDRYSNVSVSFVEGTDDRGVLYHHPAVRVHVQLARRVALAGRAEWIRSATYRETSVFVGLDLTSLSGR